MNDLYYMQFSNAVLEIMKTAKEALDEDEYKRFIDSVQKLCKEDIRTCMNELTKYEKRS